MSAGNVHLSRQVRRQLRALGRATGLRRGDALQRWALCISLADPSPPQGTALEAVHEAETMAQAFTGAHREFCLALLRARCQRDGLCTEDASVLATQLQLHVRRGLGYLVTGPPIHRIGDLFRWLPATAPTEPDPSR